MPNTRIHRLLIVGFLRILLATIGMTQSIAASATLRQVANFGSNPSNIKMFLYSPDRIPAHPAVLVGLHWCHGTAQAFHSGTGYASLADKYGFLVIYPNANSSDSCWDVHSNAALSHDGGGDPSGIVSMVKYVVRDLGADSTRVFVTGHSSGGMMTNVMVGSYPDIFQAGSAFAGVPFSCFSGSGSWNSACATGSINKTASEWGNAVRAAYPSYKGARPRMQLWHGTQDAVLDFKNFAEEVEQWTNVLGTGANPSSTEQNTLRTGWIRNRYNDPEGRTLVESIQETGEPHNLQILADKVVSFFGLDGTSSTDEAPWGKGKAIEVRRRGDALEILLPKSLAGASISLLDASGRPMETNLGSAFSNTPGGFALEPPSKGLARGLHFVLVRHEGRTKAIQPVVFW